MRIDLTTNEEKHVEQAALNNNLDIALELAAAGFPMFPLASDGKVPRIPAPPRGTGRGHHDGTTDPATIRTWAKLYPDANWGARIPDHLIVVDEDVRSGDPAKLAEIEEAHGKLPATLEVRTPTGGRHLYYMRPSGALRCDLNGVQVKHGGAGYCVVPPSKIGGQAYEWRHAVAPVALPDWAIRLLRPPPAERPSSYGRPVRHGRRSRTDRAADWFNEHGDLGAILRRAGWVLRGPTSTVENGRWLRPGKRGGHSATTKKIGGIVVFYNFSAATVFDEREGYSPFGVKRLLEHGGDTKATVEAVEELMDRG